MFVCVCGWLFGFGVLGWLFFFFMVLIFIITLKKKNLTGLIPVFYCGTIGVFVVTCVTTNDSNPSFLPLGSTNDLFFTM